MHFIHKLKIKKTFFNIFTSKSIQYYMLTKTTVIIFEWEYCALWNISNCCVYCLDVV